MKRLFLLTIFLCIAVKTAVCDPSVSNVRNILRSDGSKIVDIYFDLTEDAVNWVVTISYTLDGGSTFTVATSLTGLSNDGTKLTASISPDVLSVRKTRLFSTTSPGWGPLPSA